MGAPVIVQGTAVNAAPIPAQVYGDVGETGVTTPTPAKTGCNDPIFALLFYGNVAAQVVVAMVYGRDAVVEGSNYAT